MNFELLLMNTQQVDTTTCPVLMKTIFNCDPGSFFVYSIISPLTMNVFDLKSSDGLLPKDHCAQD